MSVRLTTARSSRTLLFEGRPQAVVGPDHRLTFTLDDGVHAGLDGVRVMLSRLSALEPDVCAEVAEARPAEWNALFRGSFPEAPPMAALASSCSERRLHAESEQLFRILNVAAEAVVAAAGRAPLMLVVRGAGRLDLPSLRGLVRIAERAACVAAPLTLVVADLAACRTAVSPRAARIRRRLLGMLATRLGASVEPGRPASLPEPDPVPPSAERELLTASVEAASPELRLAAALAAMRAAFFSTNYDGGVTAAERALALLDAEPQLQLSAVRGALAELTIGDDPASIRIGPDDVGELGDVRSLALRYLGTIAVFVLGYADAEYWFTQAIAAGATAPTRARARLLRALLRIKRLGEIEAGFADVADGLADLATDESEAARVEMAWLYNVRALGHVQRRDGAAAMADEQRAIRLVAQLSSVDATHLKVNLVSNVSVLREYAGELEDALRVWRRFSLRSRDWGDSFFKHHAYREGGLLIKAGQTEGLQLLVAAYERATRTYDDFYQMLIALELGALLLGGRGCGDAERWLAAALAHAEAVGDPYHWVLAELGLALARSRRGPASEERERLAERLARSSSYPDEAAELATALAHGEADELRARLPAVRTKLNRPFRLVRFELQPA